MNETDENTEIWKRAYLEHLAYKDAQYQLKKLWHQLQEIAKRSRVDACRTTLDEIEIAENVLLERKKEYERSIESLTGILDQYEMMFDGRVMSPMCYVQDTYAIPFWFDTSINPPEINWYTSYWMTTDKFNGQMISHETAIKFEVEH